MCLGWRPRALALAAAGELARCWSRYSRRRRGGGDPDNELGDFVGLRKTVGVFSFFFNTAKTKIALALVLCLLSLIFSAKYYDKKLGAFSTGEKRAEMDEGEGRKTCVTKEREKKKKIFLKVLSHIPISQLPPQKRNQRRTCSSELRGKEERVGRASEEQSRTMCAVLQTERTEPKK